MMNRFTSTPDTGGSVTIVGGSVNLGIDTVFTGISTVLNNRTYYLGQTFTNGVSLPESEKYSGNIIFLDNRPSVTRSISQKEDVKIILLVLKNYAQKQSQRCPYFDDFDPQSNYYKVLFKPGYPVRSRELNNLQSILQNQVEDVGNHLFKEGAKVIPGNITYNQTFYAIQIQEEFLGVPVSLYLDQLVGQKIRGRDSGVTAKVITYIITDEESERRKLYLICNFNSSSTDAETETFFDNEVLVTEVNINYVTTFISAGEGLLNTLTSSKSTKGSSFTLNDGVYFLRGTFVDVKNPDSDSGSVFKQTKL